VVAFAEMLPYVFGLAIALSWAGIPLGALLAGALSEATGVRVALVAAGGLYLLATLVPLTTRAWREMDRRQPAELAQPTALVSPTGLPLPSVPEPTTAGTTRTG
jgi:MFS family permease